MVNCIHVARWAPGYIYALYTRDWTSIRQHKKSLNRLIWAHRERKNATYTHINMLHSFSGNKLINLLEIPHSLTSVKRLKYTNFHIPIWIYAHEGRASLRAAIDYNVLLTILSTNRIIYICLICLVLLKNTSGNRKKFYISA